MRQVHLTIVVAACQILTASIAGCSGGTDSEDPAACESRAAAYTTFMDTHRDCTQDSDCAVIGDCGPHANFAAVRAEHAEEATTLHSALCGEAYDGPTYDAVCQDGKCQLSQQTGYCGMPTADGVGGG